MVRYFYSKYLSIKRIESNLACPVVLRYFVRNRRQQCQEKTERCIVPCSLAHPLTTYHAKVAAGVMNTEGVSLLTSDSTSPCFIFVNCGSLERQHTVDAFDEYSMSQHRPLKITSNVEIVTTATQPHSSRCIPVDVRTYTKHVRFRLNQVYG